LIQRNNLFHLEENVSLDALVDRGWCAVFKMDTLGKQDQRSLMIVREVKKGRSKRTTAEFFEIPESAIQSILKRSE